MTFKPYPLSPDRYTVGSDGSIYGLINSQANPRQKPKKLSPWLCPDGYLHVSLRLQQGENPKRRGVHQVVCTTFHGPRPSTKHECAHKDGVRTNNHAKNLRWATRKENARDRDLHGKTVWGENATRGKLTENQARAVPVLRAAGFSLASIGIMFSVSAQAIHRITQGKSWARLP